MGQRVGLALGKPLSENEGEQSGVSFDSKSASVKGTTGNNENAEHLLESTDTKNPRIREKLSIQTKISKSLLQDKETYELEKFEKNAMIIFNHEHFLGRDSRRGTDLDVAALEDTFKQFRFDVTTRNDLTKQDLFDELERFTKINFNAYGCICVAILTHGQDGGFLRAYDTRYSEREVFSCFDALANPTLVAKPIIFLIQACRGPTPAAGVPNGCDQNVEFDADSLEIGSRPTESDMIIFHSSFFGRASVRVVEGGTWFIQTVCKQMMLHGSTYHLEELFLKVRQNVAAMEHHGIKQMPTVTSTLLKKLYLKKIDDTKIMVKSETNCRDDTWASETLRKRQQRAGLNVFNKEPNRGIAYLYSIGFLENCPVRVARFLIKTEGLSKEMIGEYLSDLHFKFNMAVLECFVNELDLSGMAVDVALRRYLAHFRLPGEAQKIERLVKAFARHYCPWNIEVRVVRLRTQDTFVLASAIIMLNTNLHTPNLKPVARMSLDDFVRKVLRGYDFSGEYQYYRDIYRELARIYKRVKSKEFRPKSDHVTEVMEVQAMIVGKKPNLVQTHRRLVWYGSLYEIPDIHKKEPPGEHQREVFLFNDLLVITEILIERKTWFTLRHCFRLGGMMVNLFSAPHYPFGIRLSRHDDNTQLVTFNARNEHDRRKFVEDLRESIAETDDTKTIFEWCYLYPQLRRFWGVS